MYRVRPGVTEILNKIVAIEPQNSFLQYIVKRIQREDYRGIHISQHNRYDLERLLKILQGIFSTVGMERFRIPLGDDDGRRDPNCEPYYRMVKQVKINSGIGTINSLKKNFFVDFQRMGLLKRFDISGYRLVGTEKGQVYHGQLTDRAHRLINSTLTERYKIFTDALDDLFSNETANIANTLYYSDYKNDRIHLDEFMLIMTDDRPEIRDKKIDLLDSWRSLERFQQIRAIDYIKEYCNPDNFYGDKTQRRDYGNWKNESQQIFSLLKNTVYFDISNNTLRLNTGRYGIFTDSRIQTRTESAKTDYFNKHGIAKRDKCELHHVIPFSSARNKTEFQLIDDWMNLVYLSSSKHEEFPKNRNRNIILFISPGLLSFKDFDENLIVSRNGINSWYSEGEAPHMLKHNRELLKTVYGYTVPIASE